MLRPNKDRVFIMEHQFNSSSYIKEDWENISQI